MLAGPLTSPITYWSILKTFLNNKKTHCVPPLFHENIFMTYFKENKAELINKFFKNQCSLLSNKNFLPTDLLQLRNKCPDSIYFNTIGFSKSRIARIITHLDPNKAYSHMLCIRMKKL